MKKGKVFFKPIEGSAPLSITFYSGSKGDAIEAADLNGVGFFSPNGELLSVIFDDVNEKNDNKILEFKHYRVELFINNGIIEYKVNRNLKQVA